MTDPIADEVGRLSHAGWTGGCDFVFLLEEPEPSGDDVQLQPSPWVGGWSSSSHLGFCRIALRGARTPVVALGLGPRSSRFSFGG